LVLLPVAELGSRDTVARACCIACDTGATFSRHGEVEAGSQGAAGPGGEGYLVPAAQRLNPGSPRPRRGDGNQPLRGRGQDSRARSTTQGEPDGNLQEPGHPGYRSCYEAWPHMAAIRGIPLTPWAASQSA
jgi:hypothetical protein